MNEHSFTMRDRLQLNRNQSFIGLTVAQFLGHLNDNFLKMVVSLVAVEAALEQASLYLSLASVLVVLPYLLFSGYAGHLADIAPKRQVMIACKVAEIAISGAGMLMLVWLGSVVGLLFILFLMAAHETFFSPSKYGSVAEIVAAGGIARANGVLEASRYVAVIAGTAAGGMLMELWGGERYRIGLVSIAIAVCGWMVTRRIKHVDASCTARSWPLDPWSKLPQGLRRLAASRTLAIAAASITFFESIAALVMLAALLLVKVELGIGDAAASALCAYAAIGCGAGVLLCGRLSRPTVELGVVPMAGLAVAAVLGLLATSPNTYASLAGLLFVLGVCGGFFFLPCLAWLQKATAADERGLVISTNNFLSMAGVLSASAALFAMHDVMGLTPKTIFGAVAAGMVLYVLTIVAISGELRLQLLAVLRSMVADFRAYPGSIVGATKRTRIDDITRTFHSNA